MQIVNWLHIVAFMALYSILRCWVLNRAAAEGGSCDVDSDFLQTYTKLDSAMTTISQLWRTCRHCMEKISQLPVCIH